MNRPDYFKRNNSTDDLANVCFQTIPSDLCQIRCLPYTQTLSLNWSIPANKTAKPTKRRLTEKPKKRSDRQLERTARF